MPATSQVSPTPESGNCNAAARLNSSTFAPADEVGKFRGFRLVSFEETREMVGFKSRTSMYTAMKEDPKFPRPVYRGKSVFFFEDELIGYLENLRVQRDSGAQAGSIQTAKAVSRTAIAGKAAKRMASAKGGVE